MKRIHTNRTARAENALQKAGVTRFRRYPVPTIYAIRILSADLSLCCAERLQVQAAVAFSGSGLWPAGCPPSKIQA